MQCGVIHGVEPHAVLVAQVFDVAASENPARQIPVVELAVDDHLPRRRQELHPQVLGLGGEGDTAATDGREQQEHAEGLFHGEFLLGCRFQVSESDDKRVGLRAVAGVFSRSLWGGMSQRCEEHHPMSLITPVLVPNLSASMPI